MHFISEMAYLTNVNVLNFQNLPEVFIIIINVVVVVIVFIVF